MNNNGIGKFKSALNSFMHPKDVNMLEGSIVKGLFALLLPKAEAAYPELSGGKAESSLR